MTILLIAEHDNATLSDQTAKAMSAAAAIGGDVHVFRQPAYLVRHLLYPTVTDDDLTVALNPFASCVTKE